MRFPSCSVRIMCLPRPVERPPEPVRNRTEEAEREQHTGQWPEQSNDNEGSKQANDGDDQGKRQPGSCACARQVTRHPCAVVCATANRVAQDLVSLVELLHSRARPRISARIGMPLPGKATVRNFDDLGIGTGIDLQRCVVIRHRCPRPLTARRLAVRHSDARKATSQSTARPCSAHS